MRVLAITTNTSLVVALGSMMRDWDVVSVRDVDEAAAQVGDSSVVLIDFGETDAGLQAAERLYRGGVTIPSVVLGDMAIDDSHVPVLVRPFSLEELSTAMREASTAAPRSPAPIAPPEEPRRSGLSVVPPVEAEPEPAPPVDEAVPMVEVEAPEPVAPPPPPAPMPQARPQPSRGPLAAPLPTPMPVVTRSAPTPHAPPEPVSTPAAEAEPAGAAGRWRLRRRASEPAPEELSTDPPLVRRLRVAAAHVRELQELVEELPFLADLQAVADGLAEEIETHLVCPVVSVLVLQDEGFGVIAHRGLSRVEASMMIPQSQPLFGDVIRTGEGILIQPVDLAQGLVAGIGGARTEAIMAAPAMVGRECVAVVVAGGTHFSEAQLDRLSDLAAEAAPGLAVAIRLEQLRGARA